MTDLFDHQLQENLKKDAPLAARMRPRTLEEYVGQEHIIGEGKLLRRAIEADRLFSSIILWGPPGTGKTTLAQIIANQTQSHFETLSAVLDGKPRLREVVKEASERRKLYNKPTILFVDEIHRWNKAQQDALLPYVENGMIRLIGATTENPFFTVIGALVSRSRVFQLRGLNQRECGILLDRALADETRGFGSRRINLHEAARKHLVEIATGDARNALNALELAVESTKADADGIIQITLDVAQESIQHRAVLYDKDGDSHYDTISAFIKSVRGSDPDAALYWLAKMIYAGENPHFILRRLLILAGEDIGLADPNALVVSASALTAFEFLGMPEGIYTIVEATIYLATAPKSNSTGAYFKALKRLEDQGQISVPNHLKDGNRDAKQLKHGEGYVYPHTETGHFTPQQYLPKRLLGTYFYKPSAEGYEAEISARLEAWREAQRKALGVEKHEFAPELGEEKIKGMKRGK